MIDFCSRLKQFPKGWTKPLVMGVLNVTPDSFHDGGVYFSPAAAGAQLQALIHAGADIIDIGGMSSRPGHTVIPVEEELRRVLPLLQAYAGKISVPLSIDTDKPAVARAALASGATILNDTSGQSEGEMFRIAAEFCAPLVLMHRAGEAGKHADIVAEVKAFFAAAIAYGCACGMDPWQFILDPGLGFHKDATENESLMAAIADLASLGNPLLIGYSHKRFVAARKGETHGQAPQGNAEAAAISIRGGAHIVRVHEPEAFTAVYRQIEGES